MGNLKEQRPRPVLSGPTQIAQSETTKIKSLESRPRLIFFRFKYEHDVPHFLLLHEDEQVRCLQQFFDVTVVRQDCDFRVACEATQADIALFESGLETTGTRRPQVSNAGSEGSIPKVALLNCDGGSELRSGILADLDEWKVDAVFGISAAIGQHIGHRIPEIFYLPNFVDGTVFRDYGFEKVIPVLLSGAEWSLYPWRQKVFPILAQHFATFRLPHPGYVGEVSPNRVLHGPAYARVLNAASVSAACGSVTNDLLRKHLEIPGSGCCLVTEDTPTLRAAGFADMANCIFATPSTVVEKVQQVLEDRDLLTRLCRGGVELVHNRHLMAHRTQLRDWFELYSKRRPGSRIVQTSMFGELQLSDLDKSYWWQTTFVEGDHLRHVRRGDRELVLEQRESAAAHYAASLRYLPKFPEAQLGQSLVMLERGDARGALRTIMWPLRQSLVRYGKSVPDPVEWAVLVVCLIVLGRLRAASRRLAQVRQLDHVEIERVRQLLSWLTHQSFSPATEGKCLIRSIHSVPWDDDREWRTWIVKIFLNCGRTDWAHRVGSSLQLQDVPSGIARTASRRPREGCFSVRRLLRRSSLIHPLPAIPPTLSGLDHPEFCREAAERLQNIVRSTLARWQSRCATVPIKRFWAARSIHSSAPRLVRESSRK